MKPSAHSRPSDFRMVEYLCFRLLPVQILLAAVGAVNGMCSSLFASNCVGAQALSAVGLYNPIRQLIGAVGVMLLGGSQILCGKYMGKNQLSETQKIFSVNIAACSLFSVAAMLLMLGGGMMDLTGMFTRDELTRGYFNQYLIGMAVGILPQLLGQQLSGFLSLENQTRLTTVASVAYMIANLVLNYLFIVVLQLEAFGLALASSLGQWVFFGVQMLYYVGGKSDLKLRLSHLRWREGLEIVRTGIPSALSSGYLTVRSFFVNMLLVSYVGSLGLSAFAACNAFLDLFWAIPSGMLAVSRMLISVSTGEEDRSTLREIMRVVFRRYIPLMALISLGLILSAPVLTGLYYQDTADTVYTMTLWGFRILPLCMPLSIICMHFVCYGQASGKMVLVHLLSVLDGAVFVVLFSALLIPRIGMNGVYVANVLNGAAVAVVILVYAWIRTGRFPGIMDELMVIPRDFGAAEEDRLDIAVDSMDEVVRISRRVQKFCLEKGIDRRRAYLAALAVEEMAGNVVSHGFEKDKKSHTVQLRVVCKEDTLILRIKDDCVPFDPEERRELVDPSDPVKNIGIRMVYALAQDIKYQNILGLNALTIRLPSGEEN